MNQRHMRGWRAAAAVGATATAILLVTGVTAAGAQEPPPDEPSTTVPETTIPADTGTTATVPETTTSAPEVPATTAPTSTTAEEPTTTTTRPSDPPSSERACDTPVRWTYKFLVDESIEEGESFDDTNSDFSVTFTEFEVRDGYRWVTFEGTHPVGQLALGGLYKWTAYSLGYWPTDIPALTQSVPLSPDFGPTIQWAAFCFPYPADIGVEDPVSPTVTAAPANPVEAEVPVTATVVAPPVLTTDEPAPDGGTLPETGNDVLPLVLAGGGLAAVGGGLLLGRRVRRAEA